MDKEEKERIKNKKDRVDTMKTKLHKLEQACKERRKQFIDLMEECIEQCGHPVENIKNTRQNIYTCQLCGFDMTKREYDRKKEEQKEENEEQYNPNRGYNWL